MKKEKILAIVLLCAILLTGCVSRSSDSAAPSPAPAQATPEPAPTATATPEATEAPTPTPTAEPTASPTLSPTEAPTTAPTAEPTAAPTPTVTPALTQTPAGNKPIVSKQPVDATVAVNGACYFEADFLNAIWAVWHFVSPDGKTDLPYDQIGTRFPNMQVTDGMYSKMLLSSIPAEANGWKVYCRYTNNAGYTDTNTALLTVKNGAAPAPSAMPTPTPAGDKPFVRKHPADATVNEGGSCVFEADYLNAIWAVWHFVSPDGKTDLPYDQIGTRFPNMQVKNGMYSKMELGGIPAEANGWKVYCRYTNNAGFTDTNTALLTVNKGAGPAPSAKPTPTPTPAGDKPYVRKHPVDAAVAENGTCSFEADYLNAIWAVWHFVSPDGKTDLPYDQIGTRFPNMQVTNGMYSKMTLSNIPAEANGWKVYCRYTNNAGYTDTNTALLTVGSSAPTPTPSADPAPVVNQWTETPDLTVAIARSSVNFSPPIAAALPDGVTLDTYRSFPGIIEARYSGGALVIRKSYSYSGSELSGDMNSYSKTWDHGFKNVGTVQCRGNGDNVNEATFSAGNGNYSISYHIGQEGSGLTLDQINSLIQGVG